MNTEDAPIVESSTSQKRKRASRGPNQVRTGAIMYVTRIGDDGLPVEPKAVAAKFRSACGFILREEVSITLRDWRKLEKSTIKKIWGRIGESFKFPKGTEEAVEKAAFISMGKKFRNWKSDLNKKYVQQNKIPEPKKMGKITKAEWEEFVAQKTAPEAKELSEARSEQAKKNIYPHHLGSSGYAPKVEVWRRIISEAIEAGTFDPLLQDCDERTINWILGRANLTDEGKLQHPELVAEVVKKVGEIVEKQKKGAFKPRRENDQLTAALGNPEHGGRVRGVSSQISLKEAFPQYADSYKKHK
jgi:hypothetical protein